MAPRAVLAALGQVGIPPREHPDHRELIAPPALQHLHADGDELVFVHDVIELRLALSDRWDDAMRIVFKPRRVRVRAVAA